jgi:Phytanoyl-CoA dioxygenase (PhyH)
MYGNAFNWFLFLKSYISFNLRRRYRRTRTQTLSPELKDHVDNLRKEGYSIIPGFLTAEDCEELRNQVDSAMAVYPEALWRGAKGADQRIFGINLCGGVFKEFFADKTLSQIGEAYFDCEIVNLQTLAGRIDAIDGNIGSGEGWHRDANHFQYKAIVYLSDVHIENGPFQLIAKSHHFGRALVDSQKMKLDDYLNTRFKEEQVNRILKDEPERLITFAAPAGTVLLVDTSTIHRGSPVESGRRYALFNYYYPYYDISGRLEKFSPRLEPKMLIHP